MTGRKNVRSNRVEVAISSLRNKLRQAGVEQPFHTVRVVGLKLKSAADLEADLLAG